MFFQVHTEQPTIQPEVIARIGGLMVTNAMIAGVLVTLILASLALFIKKSVKLKPSKFQTVIEMIVETFIGLLSQITGNREQAQKLLPLIGTLFLFLGCSNLIGLIPVLNSVTIDGVALIRTATNDFNMTFSIALAMVIVTNVMSVKTFGWFGHLGKFFKFKEVYHGFKESIGKGCLALIDFCIGLLDIVSEIAKVISLSLRLFGNMYAGDVLAGILLGSFALFIPSTWLAMNLLVAVLQAMVFGSLTAAYYTLAVQQVEQQQT